MTAEIICVGTEILLGNIVNTNAAYLSERLAALGISVFFETTVGDNPERVEEVIRTGMKRSDILILSGGLGPTKDDLTKEGKSMRTGTCGRCRGEGAAHFLLYEHQTPDDGKQFKTGHGAGRLYCFIQQKRHSARYGGQRTGRQEDYPAAGTSR